MEGVGTRFGEVARPLLSAGDLFPLTLGVNAGHSGGGSLLHTALHTCVGLYYYSARFGGRLGGGLGLIDIRVQSDFFVDIAHLGEHLQHGLLIPGT